jgi:hypothetical protein
MKDAKVHAVDMVRKIRDRHAKALAGKSESEIIAFYRAAGVAATRSATRAAPKQTAPTKKKRQSAKLIPRTDKSQRTSRATRG